MKSVLCWVAAVIAVAVVSPGVAHAIVYPCTSAGLSTAASTSGTATFSCMVPTTITVTSPLTVAASGVVLDGGGLLTISGGGTVMPFSVLSGASLALKNLTVSDGKATDGTSAGCIASFGTLDIADSTLTRCQHPTYGALYNNGGALTLSRVAVVNNTGASAIGSLFGSLTMTNTTVGGNLGRGILSNGGTTNIANSTIASNTSWGIEGSANLTSTIVANNGDGSTTYDLTGSFSSGGYVLVGSTQSATPSPPQTTDQFGIKPLLGPLGNNGGATMTYPLLACSPGINGGAISGGPTTDQRGSARIVAGAMDIGAYESALLPCVTIESTEQQENGPLTFTVRLSGRSSSAAQVSYATSDGTAKAGVDYTASSGTVSFGTSTTATFSVPVFNDDIYEYGDTVFVTLSGAVGATINGLGTATGTIVNDDAPPELRVDNASVIEGDSGTTTMVFVLRLIGQSDVPASADYTTVDYVATAADNDYVATSGRVTFPGAPSTQTVSITVNSDTKFEGDEQFALQPMNLVDAYAFGLFGFGMITNDDPVPSLRVDDVSVVEGTGATSTASARFTISLSNPTSYSASVHYSTVNGAATIADGDYLFPFFNSVTFAPGETVKTVDVFLGADAKYETDETFSLVLDSEAYASIADGTGGATIVNDDAPPVIAVDDVTVTEGNDGTVSATFTLTLTGQTALPATVNYATADGTATTANGDYVATAGTVTFAAGETTKTITVVVNGDAVYETNETFALNLSSAVNATIGKSGTGTIGNDDDKPTLAIGDVTVTEGNSGTVAATFTVQSSAAAGATLTVDYATSDGTATAGADYVATSGTLTFAVGETSKTITVTINGDAIAEGNETFFVTLSGAVNATLSAAMAKGTGTIDDDEGQPGFSLGATTASEGNTGTAPFVVTVTLSGASAQTTTVDWATSNGTATAGEDYVAGAGTLTFAPGEVAKQITVTVNGDTKREADETFVVTLSNATGGAAIATATATVTITNDDALPMIVIAPASVVEGNSGTSALTFAVTLSHASVDAVTVEYTSSDGTATAGSDYVATAGTLTFAPGETSAVVRVTVNGDTDVEADETVVVTLANAQNGTLGTASAAGTITNDDDAVGDAATPGDGATDMAPADGGGKPGGRDTGGCRAVDGAVGDVAAIGFALGLVAIAMRRRRRAA